MHDMTSSLIHDIILIFISLTRGVYVYVKTRGNQVFQCIKIGCQKW